MAINKGHIVVYVRTLYYHTLAKQGAHVVGRGVEDFLKFRFLNFHHAKYNISACGLVGVVGLRQGEFVLVEKIDFLWFKLLGII